MLHADHERAARCLQFVFDHEDALDPIRCAAECLMPVLGPGGVRHSQQHRADQPAAESVRSGWVEGGGDAEVTASAAMSALKKKVCSKKAKACPKDRWANW